MSKKFSIIVVCYERYYNVQCLIYSLLSQTYDNFEVILIHDGYNTEHRQIIEPYLNDKRFKIIDSIYAFNSFKYQNLLRNTENHYIYEFK